MSDQLKWIPANGRLYVLCPFRLDQFPCPKRYTTIRALIVHVERIHRVQLSLL